MLKTIFMLTALFAALGWCSAVATASDHLDAPSLESKGQVDINDLYAFQSPTNANNSVLVLTVNPFAISTATFGTSGVAYEFVIDNNGDAMGDVSYRATFTNAAGGQNLMLEKNGTTIATGMTDAAIATTGGGMVQAGMFDDPFFFDLAGFKNGFAFTGADAFAGANVSAIVLEVPSAELGGQNVGIWARSLQDGNQVDRVGRPAINTALIPSAKKEAFNVGAPADDQASFDADVEASITGLSDAANATALSAILLPDVLTYDSGNSGGFLNGRKLADDVIDAELNLLSAGAVTGDGVDMNDVAFRGAFPYLAGPNAVPEPSSLFLLISAVPVLRILRRR